MRLIDIPMGENDVNATTVGDFLKELLLRLWEEGEGFSGKRPFGNSDWQYQVYASLIKAGYEIGSLDEYGYVDDVDYKKADELVVNAIKEVFDQKAEPVRHGKWIYAPSGVALGGTDATYDYKCSLCGEYSVEGSKYCPNCGKKMKSGFVWEADEEAKAILEHCGISAKEEA